MNKIKLLATSDLHGKLESFQSAVLKERPDVVVVAGDVTNRSKDREFRGAAVDAWASLLKFCLRPECARTDFVIVPGNHDAGTRKFGRFISKVADNIVYLDKNLKEPAVVKGMTFWGASTYRGARPAAGADVYVFHRCPFKDAPEKGRTKLNTGGAAIVLFGHSHISRCDWRENGDAVSLNVSNKSKNGGMYIYHLLAMRSTAGRWTVDKKDSVLNNFIP